MAIPMPAAGFDRKTVEPRKRMVAGEYRFAYHRFPIKGGITPREAMLQTLVPSGQSFASKLFGSPPARATEPSPS